MIEKLFFLGAGVLLANDKARQAATDFVIKGSKIAIDTLNKKGVTYEADSTIPTEEVEL